MCEEYSTESMHPITIGCAEDDYMQLKTTVEILEENGFLVDFAMRDGTQLVRVAEQCPKRPDIDITDLKIPKLHSVESAAKLIGRWPESKVMMLIGETEKCYVDSAKHAGVVTYLYEAIFDKTLSQAIRKTHETGKACVGAINL